MKRRRFIYFILWIASLVGISYYGGAISYGLFWGITLIPVICVLYLFLTFMLFKIYQRIESRSIVAKQPMPYYFVLANETFFPFISVSVKLYSELSAVNDMVDGKEYQLLPGEEYVYHTKIVCKYRGEYEVGVKEITLTDIFGLFRFRYRVSSPIQAIVLPRVLHMEEISGLKDLVNTSYLESFQQPVEPDVVTRDYILGDAFKHIHWKASAREQKLKTRKMLGERRQEVAIVYDTKRYSKNMLENLPLENQILEIVLAVGSFFAENNIRITSYSMQRGVHQCRVDHISQFQRFYEDVSAVNFFEDEDVSVMFEELFRSGTFTETKTLIFVTHRLEQDVFCMLQELTQKGTDVVVYMVTDENVDELMKQGNARLKVVSLPVDGNLEELL